MRILSKAQNEIILEVVRKGYVTNLELQKLCNKSRKTISVEIERINEYLHKYGAQINQSKREGFSLEVLDYKNFNNFSNTILYRNKRKIGMANRYLAYFIICELIRKNDYLYVNDLANNLFYSRSTISRYIIDVKRILVSFDCILVSRPNHGIKISGTEWSKRVAYVFCNHSIKELNSIIIKDEISNKLELHDDYSIHNCVSKIVQVLFEKYEVSMSLINKEIIESYICFSLRRNIACFNLTFSDKIIEKIKKSEYYQVSTKIVNQMKKKELNLLEVDQIGLAIFISCYVEYDIDRIQEKNFVYQSIDDVYRFINYISEIYPGIEQALDDKFIVEMTEYLIGMKIRISYNMPNESEGSLIKKAEGSFFLELCCEFAEFFFEIHTVKIMESEILNLYFIFVSSFLRNPSISALFHTGIVSRYGKFYVNSLIESASLYQFKDIKKITPINYYGNESNVSHMENFDLILSDIDLPKTLNVPVIPLDFQRNHLNKGLLRTQFRKALFDSLRNKIKKDSLIIGVRCSSKNDVFHYLSEHLITCNDKNLFYRDCMKNESYMSHERDNRIAIVSTSKLFYDSNQISIIFAENAFTWESQKIEMIIFLSRKGKNFEEIKILNKAVKTLLSDDASIVSRLKKMDADQICHYISNNSYV